MRNAGMGVSQPRCSKQDFPAGSRGAGHFSALGWDGTGGMQLGGTPGKGRGEGEPLPSSADQLYIGAMNVHSTDPIKSTHPGQLRNWDFCVSDLLQTFRHCCLVWQAPHLMLSSVGRWAVLLSDSPGELNSVPEEAVLRSITVSLTGGPPHGVLLPAQPWGDHRAHLSPPWTSALLSGK